MMDAYQLEQLYWMWRAYPSLDLLSRLNTDAREELVNYMIFLADYPTEAET